MDHSPNPSLYRLRINDCILAKIFPLKKHLTLQIIVAVLIGFEYGFLVSLGMTIYGGVAAFVAYWLSGILFDFYHAAGNFAFYLVLYKPLTMALEKYERGSYDKNLH